MSRPSDIVVIGAGVIGCAVAHELARRGAAVRIVDERAAGMGATQASAGVLAPYIEARDGSPLLDLTVSSLALYDDFIDRVVADSGTPIPYRRTGTLDAAVNDADLRKLQATAAVLARRGVPCLLLDAADVRSHEPQLGGDVIGGLLIETHGYVAAHDLTRALAAAARRHGAQFSDPRRVRRIVRRGGDVVVETDGEALSAGAVVLAAGSWSGQIGVDGITPSVPVRPVRGQLLVLEWQGAPLRRVTWSSRCYMVPWEDGTLLVGATSEDAGFDERTTVAGVRDLLEAACEVVPHAWGAGFRSARVGLRPASADELPVIGASSIVPNVMYATGHYRNGILLAPLTAKVVADAMLDRRVDPLLHAVSPSRFEHL
jgi:glycine oxidase